MAVANELELLASQFSDGATKYPGLQHYVIWWTEDGPRHPMHSDQPLDVWWQDPTCVATAPNKFYVVCGFPNVCYLNHPGGVWKQFMRRDFGVLTLPGTYNQIHNPAEQNACLELFGVLARRAYAAFSTAAIHRPPWFDEIRHSDSKGWDPHWCLLLHALLKTPRKRSHGHEISVLDDAFLDSARLLTRLREINHRTNDWPQSGTPLVTASVTPHRKTEKKLPDNPDVLRLCRLLEPGVREGRAVIDIAREFTGEMKGDDKRAKSLMVQAYRYKHLWRSDSSA